MNVTVFRSSVRILCWSSCRATVWWWSCRMEGRACAASMTHSAWWRPTSARHTSTTATCTWAPSARRICASWIWAKCETRHEPNRCSSHFTLASKLTDSEAVNVGKHQQEYLLTSSLLQSTLNKHSPFIWSPFSSFSSDRCPVYLLH